MIESGGDTEDLVIKRLELCYSFLKLLLKNTVIFNCNSRFNQAGEKSNFNMLMR